MPDNQLLKELKVFPVSEIVTYGFSPDQAPLDMRGTHLPPQEFHKALEDPNSVVIDVRNFNETVIGKFAPPKAKVMTHEISTSTGTENESTTTTVTSTATSTSTSTSTATAA